MNRLILGLVVFFGVHSISLLALNWRNRIAERLGRRAWQGIYSIAALMGFYLLVAGYRAARVSDAVLYASPGWFRYVAALLMLPAFTLALASVLPGRIKTRAQHPLLLATMLWAVAHLLTNGGAADVLCSALFSCGLLPCVYRSIVVRPARRFALPGSTANDAIAVIGGIALYVAFLFSLHARWIGVPILGA